MCECKFCKDKNMTESSFWRPSDDYTDYIFHDEHGFHVNVYCDCGDYALLCNIKYCPYCGRKLEEKCVEHV